jgi:hypothetical protein
MVGSMPRRRSGDEETNWRFRDNFTWYSDQVKAVPEVAKGLASLPREWFGAVKEMADDMRSHEDPKGQAGPKDPDPGGGAG